jgi:hypothetical protein
MRMQPDFTRPATWPLATVLPLIRRPQPDVTELGVLLADHGPVVYRLDWLAVRMAPELLATCDRVTYASYRALSEAGWEID